MVRVAEKQQVFQARSNTPAIQNQKKLKKLLANGLILLTPFEEVLR